MIGKVTGRLDYRGADHVLVETAGGVGYLVLCSERTLAAMPEPGGVVALYTELIVREDLQQLVGFRTLAEREWYRLLSSVQGVGAKAALALLGALGTDGLARALSLGDVAAIRAAPGIGPKLAQRLVLELQAKAPSVMALGAEGARPALAARTVPAPGGPTAEPSAAPDPGASRAAAQAEALSALVNLGYGQSEAAAAVAGMAASEPGLDTSGLIRASLRHLAPKG